MFKATLTVTPTVILMAFLTATLTVTPRVTLKATHGLGTLENLNTNFKNSTRRREQCETG